MADEQEVLSYWQGLGYYTRARNLRKASRHIVDHHSGIFPRDPAAIRELPGVGRYTAGAVASFAFDLPEPLVDANVARVLSRLQEIRIPVDTPAGQKALLRTRRRPSAVKSRDFSTPRLSELGALVVAISGCARCLECFIRSACHGLRIRRRNLPIKKPPQEPPSAGRRTHGVPSSARGRCCW